MSRTEIQIVDDIEAKAVLIGDLAVNELGPLEKQFHLEKGRIEKYLEDHVDEELEEWLQTEKTKFLKARRKFNKTLRRSMKARTKTEKQRNPSPTREEIAYVDRLMRIACEETQAHIQYLQASVQRLKNKVKERNIEQ